MYTSRETSCISPDSAHSLVTRVWGKQTSNHGSISGSDKRLISSPKHPDWLGGHVMPPTQCSKKEIRYIK